MQRNGIGPVQVVQADQKRADRCLLLQVDPQGLDKPDRQAGPAKRARLIGQRGRRFTKSHEHGPGRAQGHEPAKLISGGGGQPAALAAAAACMRSSDFPAPSSPSMSSMPPRPFAAARTSSRTACSSCSRPRMAPPSRGTLQRPVPPRRGKGRSVIASLASCRPGRRQGLQSSSGTWTGRTARPCRLAVPPHIGLAVTIRSPDRERDPGTHVKLP